MHKCQCGFDHTEKEELFEGTSKSAEGHSTEEAFVQAKEEGMQIKIHWQDADSSSAKAIQDIMPQTKTMKCLGHMGWVHNNQLEALTKKKKTFTAFFNQHKGKFPSVGTVKCVCANKNHNFIARPYKPACGCISDAFRRKARINHWCTANQCENDLQKYAETLWALGQYHVHDKYISGWVPVSPLTKCKYGECEEELKCQGTPYSTQSPLTLSVACPDIWDRNAQESIWHGKCHSSRNGVRTFQPEWGKPQHPYLLQEQGCDSDRLHYTVSTNIGLLQSDMSWAFEKHGKEYH